MDTTIEDKIKKLLALSKSSNENEAMLAFKMAQELLTKHNLSLDDVNVDLDIKEEILSIGDKWEEWEFILYSVIADCNFCQLLVTSFDKSHKYTLVGKDHNIIIVKEMYKYLHNTVNKLYKERAEELNIEYKKSGLMLTRQAFDSIRIGIVQGICHRLIWNKKQMQKNKFSEKLKNNILNKPTTALAISKLHTNEQNKINQYLNSKYEEIKSISPSDDEYINKFVVEGQKESKKIKLNKQIKQ